MKNRITRKTLLGVALMGTFALAPTLTSVAQAAPPDHAPAYGRRAKEDKKDKKDKYEKRDRRDNRRDDNRRDEDRRDDDRYDRDRYDRDRDYRDRYDRDRNNNRSNATFVGTVSDLRNRNSFDLRANGRTYNVYVSSLPRGLREGDEVRVYGRPYGDNDIRNANVVILNNARDRDNRNDYNNGRYDPNRKRDGRDDYRRDDYRTYSGEVTRIRNDREFDVRVGGTTYNVYASSGTRGLDEGDIVRVYGQRYGDNDIRNANVTITSNRGGNRGGFGDIFNRGDRNDNGPYRTYSGEVTQVRNDREFDIRVGNTTYNVYASSGTRGLSRGDIVRVYGQRYGENDIRNANATITRNR